MIKISIVSKTCEEKIFQTFVCENYLLFLINLEIKLRKTKKSKI
jgi:hypothetical protein